MKSKLAFLCVVLAAAAAPVRAQSVDALSDQDLRELVATYKQLHAAPELSGHEEKTAAFLAEQLRAFGYSVTDHVGNFGDLKLTGYGVVAVLQNGTGRTVLVRSELDALPVEEKTGLPYASRVRTKNDAGIDVGVMHACGHDIHLASLLGTAKMLAQLRSRWHGTVVLIGQPAEELVAGAQAMLKDGLYTRFPKPGFCLALHDTPDLPAGKVGLTPGFALAISTSVDITIRGIGGHGSKPESTKDPIVVAAQVVLALQTIVSRENSPFDPAVVTVGSIHGGAKHNIIPDQVHLQLTVRAYKEEVRKHILASIERITKGIASAAGIPESLTPVVEAGPGGIATYNDPKLAEQLQRCFEKALGTTNVVQTPPVMGSEDFGYFGLEGGQIPICIFWLGAANPEQYRRSKEGGPALPSLHSSLWAPEPESSLRTGVTAMTAAVLDVMR